MANSGETQMIADSVRAIFKAHWTAEAAADPAARPDALQRVWRELKDQGFLSAGANSEIGLGEAMLVVEEAGHTACPAPIIPTVVAKILSIGEDAASGAGDFDDAPCAVALEEIALVSDGNNLHGTVRLVEDIGVAERLIARTQDGAAIIALNGPGVTVAHMPGLAVPALANIELSNAPFERVEIDQEKIDDALLAQKLLLAARARGAAQRAFELVLEHVQQRVQFGQAVARFQSMQHKLADCALALKAAALMISDAAQRFDAGNANWRFEANAAISYSASQLRKVSLETHHAFGAIGFSEEHEAPRHFRRVHADLGRLGGQTRSRARIADHMLAPGGAMPAIGIDQNVGAFRQEFRAWLAHNWTEADKQKERARPFHLRGRDKDFARKFGADGWLSLSWPEGAGGQSLSPLKQLAMIEELARAEAPTGSIVASAWLIGAEIIRHGSSWLKETLLPGIRSGEYAFALGYSEPEAGSDLSSLKTSAVRDGDHYIVNGQKLWGTGTEHATHIALAVRTDREARPKSAGISVLIVPTDLPGIIIQPGMALYGHTFCTQFFDEVRVPAAFLLGEENRGWGVLAGALAAERIIMGGQIIGVQKIYEMLCAHVSKTPKLRASDRVRDLIGQFGAELEAARQLSLGSVLALEAGHLPLVEGAYTKVFSGDLTERFCETALDILGDEGLLSEDAPGAPLDGRIEQMLRRSIMMVIGGGAAEIQKTIIAQRGLGLPR
jgi:alkylation response protein AidB-like acyl-CoA dehydrogenase